MAERENLVPHAKTVILTKTLVNMVLQEVCYQRCRVGYSGNDDSGFAYILAYL